MRTAESMSFSVLLLSLVAFSCVLDHLFEGCFPSACYSCVTDPKSGVNRSADVAKHLMIHAQADLWARLHDSAGQNG